MIFKRFWSWPGELKQRGILGINARNLLIAENNQRHFFPRVDDKSLTKEICSANNIPVPETYAIIRCPRDIKRIPEIIANKQEFVIKPARGSGGRGIMVITGHENNIYQTPGNALSFTEVKYRIASTLAGLYSLGGQPDKVIIEKRIEPHRIYDDVIVQGTPDIRLIFYHYQPIMAMLRLPTLASQGRANLHQGAVGVGIDIENGITLGGVCKGRETAIHPDTGKTIRNLMIPAWEQIISMGSRLSSALELVYVGVDIVIDRDGPVVLEANARPGLAIQVANHLGLRPRLIHNPIVP